MIHKLVIVTMLCVLFSAVHAQESTSLIDAVKNGQLDQVEQLLGQDIDVNAYDALGIAALHYAADQGNLDAVERLLAAKGIQVNAITLNAQTALDVAKNEEVYDVLQQHGGMAFLPIWQRLLAFFDAVNDGNLDNIGKIVNNKELAATIQKLVDVGFKYHFTLNKDTITYDGLDKVAVDGTFEASKQTGATSWSMKGFSTYYKLERQGDQWFIVDTNFASKLSTKYFWGFLLLIFSLLGLMIGFWLWMLIDCATHEVNRKALWIVFLIFCNVFAAIIYYFAVKRRRSTFAR